MKTFCITGPIIPADHYFLPHRLNYMQLQQFIDHKLYFVLHAPRQSGKTTAIEEFVRHLNHKGTYAALYINIESAQAARDDIKEALISIVEELANAIDRQLIEQNEIAIHLREMLTIHPITLNLLLNALRFISSSAKYSGLRFSLTYVHRAFALGCFLNLYTCITMGALISLSRSSCD